MAGGDTYTIIYLKLQLLAMKKDGILEWSGLEDSVADELALDIDETPEDVRVTLMYLLSCGLAETSDNISFFFPYAVENVGSETSAAKRMRDMRERNNVTPLLRDSYGEIEKEIEIELDKEKDNKNISLELKDSKQNTLISLPLVTGSGNYDVTFDYLNSLRELFPALDVEQEFRSMAAWLDSHPRNRKTPRGIKKFITGWLERSQNSMPASRTPVTQAPAATRNMSTSQYMEATAGWYKGTGDGSDATGI